MTYQLVKTRLRKNRLHLWISGVRRMGFHLPPFSSVPHLHLHVLAPASEMNSRSLSRYGPQSYWFITVLSLHPKIMHRIEPLNPTHWVHEICLLYALCYLLQYMSFEIKCFSLPGGQRTSSTENSRKSQMKILTHFWVINHYVCDS